MGFGRGVERAARRCRRSAMADPVRDSVGSIQVGPALGAALDVKIIRLKRYVWGEIMSSRSRQGVNIVGLYWAAWILGSILIVLSWFRVVSPLVGWAGFIMALAATLTSIIYRLVIERRQGSVSVAGSTRPTAVTFTENLLQIDLEDGRVISAPLAWYPKLAEASDDERARHNLETNGIYWPVLGVDVSVLDVLDGVRPPGQ
jgi:hypothetical protein